MSGRARSHPLARWGHHVSIKSGAYFYPLHQAIQDYGPNAFTVETMLCCKSKADAYWAEGYLIEQYGTLVPNGYNQSRGPGRSRLSPPKPAPAKQGSIELRMKLKAAHKALWRDPAYRARQLEQKRQLWADPKKRAAMTAHLAKPKRPKRRTIRDVRQGSFFRSRRL